jgi:isoleucyl-tRNA synthetase
VIKHEKNFFVIAKDLLNDVSKHLKNVEIVETFKGDILSDYTCYHPLYKRESILIHGEHVTTLAGTGLVHTAPGHV